MQGKLLYQEAYEPKQAWDAPLHDELATKWRKWESNLPSKVSTRRTLALHRESIGDGSGHGVSAALYAVVRQASGTRQGLVAAKARLAKQWFTTPRLELVAGNMVVNFVDNVRRALTGFFVTSVCCWLDSTVALHWIRGSGEYRQFVANRVRKIGEHAINEWRHVSTAQNLADLENRGGSPLEDRDARPENPVTAACAYSDAESKVVKEVLAATTIEVKTDSN